MTDTKASTFNARINNTQRKVYAKLAEEKLARITKNLENKIETDKENILRSLKDKLLVSQKEEQIKAHEQDISRLQREIEASGFSRYNSMPVSGSEVKATYTKQTSALKQAITDQQNKNSAIISSIWAAQKVGEALSILESIDR